MSIKPQTLNTQIASEAREARDAARPSISLLTHERPDAYVAMRGGEAVTRARFVGDVMALAAILRPGQHVVNLCADRYLFAVGLGAALVKGQITLLPPSETPVMLQQLADAYDDLYILSDCYKSVYPAPVLRVPEHFVSAEILTVPAFPAQQDAVILFTSGSTGQPVPQLKSWGALVASANASIAGMPLDLLTDATILGTVPHQHCFGLEWIILLALQKGLAIHAGRPFFAADIAAQIEKTPRPLILVTTPVHLRAMLSDRTQMPQIDLVLSATAPLSLDLARQAEAAFRCPLLEIYGCSEAGKVASRRTTENAEWRIIDGLTLRQEGAATYVSGAPIVSVPVLLSDEIELLDPTRFVLHGRTADLVNIAGKRSSISFLNTHLNAIEGVVDGVFVMPEEKDGAVARLMAFVVAPGLSADIILNALRQRIDPAFMPRPLCLLEALPRNATGKLLREDLRKLAERANVE